MNAYTERDAAFLEKHMDESYVGTFPDGSVHDKKSEIASVKSGNITITEMAPVEMNVNLYNGNTAVLTGKSHIKAIVEGKRMSEYFRFTDVWVKLEQGWRAVASQVTSVDKQQTK